MLHTAASARGTLRPDRSAIDFVRLVTKSHLSCTTLLYSIYYCDLSTHTSETRVTYEPAAHESHSAAPSEPLKVPVGHGRH